MAETSAGAVAFSRTGDPATGEFEDAVVLRAFGEVPSVEELLSREYGMGQQTPKAGLPEIGRLGQRG